MKKDEYIGTWIKPHNDSLKAQVGRGDYNDIKSIAKNVMDTLKINQNGVVLDLCCGNGLLTNIIVKHCQKIHGVDFSKNLIDTAVTNNKSKNIHYHLKNALDIDELFSENVFDKVYCMLLFNTLIIMMGKNC